MDQQGRVTTITKEEELQKYQHIQLLEPQPYNQIHRIQCSKPSSKAPACDSIEEIARYYPSGQICELLPIRNQRPFGIYRQWHPNGQIKLEAPVDGGHPQLSDEAYTTWHFHGIAKAYYPDGTLKEEIPYLSNVIQGKARSYYPNGQLRYEIDYLDSQKEGIKHSYFPTGDLINSSLYQSGLLKEATYFGYNPIPIITISDGKGYLVELEEDQLYIHQIAEGRLEGRTQLYQLSTNPDQEQWLLQKESDGSFSIQGTSCYLKQTYHLLQGVKSGIETFYYPDGRKQLTISWLSGSMHGPSYSWDPEGSLQGIRHFANDSLHGMTCAYYPNGQLMLLEEYEKDRLLKGCYYKLGDSATAISHISDGEGTAYIFDTAGHFIHKIAYANGVPILQAQ
jgi:antitoxin component YwqK of YwqJK toxin-antitoxin module